MDKCRYKTKDGHCTKRRINGICRSSNLSWCEDPAKTIDIDRMCEYSSIFGNEYVYITEEQFQALSEGKALYIPVNDEYGCFIALKNEEVQNESL